MRKGRLSMLNIKNQRAKKSTRKVTKSRYNKATPSVTLEGSVGDRISKRRLERNLDEERQGKRVTQEELVDLTMAKEVNKEPGPMAMGAVEDLFKGMSQVEALVEVADHTWQVNSSSFLTLRSPFLLVFLV